MYSSEIVKQKEIVHPWCVGQKVRIHPIIGSNASHPQPETMIGKEGIIIDTTNILFWDCTVSINDFIPPGHYFFLLEELELID